MSDGIKKPTLLIVIDGFGVAPDGDGNAITKAATPVFDRLIRTDTICKFVNRVNLPTYLFLLNTLSSYKI